MSVLGMSFNLFQGSACDYLSGFVPWLDLASDHVLKN